MPYAIRSLTIQLGKSLSKQKWSLVTAESCTGGGLAYAITAVPNSSTWFERGYVTYSNASKKELLQVKNSTLETSGAVSEETAKEMALGALQESKAHISIAITGIAGPQGGSEKKTVGTIWFAWGNQKKIETSLCHFSGNRISIRKQAIETALKKLITFLEKAPS